MRKSSRHVDINAVILQMQLRTCQFDNVHYFIVNMAVRSKQKNELNSISKKRIDFTRARSRLSYRINFLKNKKFYLSHVVLIYSRKILSISTLRCININFIESEELLM